MALFVLEQVNHIVGAVAEVLTKENLMALYGVPIKHISFDHEDCRIEIS